MKANLKMESSQERVSTSGRHNLGYITKVSSKMESYMGQVIYRI